MQNDKNEQEETVTGRRKQNGYDGCFHFVKASGGRWRTGSSQDQRVFVCEINFPLFTDYSLRVVGPAGAVRVPPRLTGPLFSAKTA